jgi:transposase
LKTLAIRLEENQHAQLSMIAQLENLTVIDAIRQAIDQWIEAQRDRPELKQRAKSLLDEIEQEAATRRGAIAALLGSDAPPAGDSACRPSGRSRPKSGDEA